MYYSYQYIRTQVVFFIVYLILGLSGKNQLIFPASFLESARVHIFVKNTSCLLFPLPTMHLLRMWRLIFRNIFLFFNNIMMPDYLLHREEKSRGTEGSLSVTLLPEVKWSRSSLKILFIFTRSQIMRSRNSFHRNTTKILNSL